MFCILYSTIRRVTRGGQGRREGVAQVKREGMSECRNVHATSLQGSSSRDSKDRRGVRPWLTSVSES